jgi:hypothetical protein
MKSKKQISRRNLFNKTLGLPPKEVESNRSGFKRRLSLPLLDDDQCQVSANDESLVGSPRKKLKNATENTKLKLKALKDRNKRLDKSARKAASEAESESASPRKRVLFSVNENYFPIQENVQELTKSPKKEKLLLKELLKPAEKIGKQKYGKHKSLNVNVVTDIGLRKSQKLKFLRTEIGRKKRQHVHKGKSIKAVERMKRKYIKKAERLAASVALNSQTNQNQEESEDEIEPPQEIVKFPEQSEIDLFKRGLLFYNKKIKYNSI